MNPFDRITVDYLTYGNARIAWELSSHFTDPLPWSFQLQVAETDVATGNWANVGAPVVNSFQATDPTRRSYGKEQNVFYRVILTTSVGTYTSQPADVMGHLTFQQWNWSKELVRKERLRLSGLNVGIKGWFVKALRSGTPCTRCLDPFTNEVTDSKCPVCLGQRWVGGYYTPIPSVFGDVNAEMRYLERNLDTEGMVMPQIVEGMFVAEPFMSAHDVWVNDSTDQRFWVHEVKTRTHIQGVPLLTVVGLRPVPFDSIVYSIAIPR